MLFYQIIQLDSTGKSSRLDLALTDNSTWNMTQNASAKNLWQGSEAEGNFVTDLSLNNSVIKFGHLDWNNDNELLEAQKAENFKKFYMWRETTAATMASCI